LGEKSNSVNGDETVLKIQEKKGAGKKKGGMSKKPGERGKGGEGESLMSACTKQQSYA